MVPAPRVHLVPEDFLERSRPLDLVVLHRHVRGVRQDPVLPEKADEVGETDPGAAHEGPDGTSPGGPAGPFFRIGSSTT